MSRAEHAGWLLLECLRYTHTHTNGLYCYTLQLQYVFHSRGKRMKLTNINNSLVPMTSYLLIKRVPLSRYRRTANSFCYQMVALYLRVFHWHVEIIIIAVINQKPHRIWWIILQEGCLENLWRSSFACRCMARPIHLSCCQDKRKIHPFATSATSFIPNSKWIQFLNVLWNVGVPNTYSLGDPHAFSNLVHVCTWK